MATYRYFRDSEVKQLDPILVSKLDMARNYSGVPYIINSGYRSGVNGVDHGITQSAHMNHMAVDLKCLDSTSRFKILKGAVQAGFCRIGLGVTHIHLDIDETKPQNVVWFEEDQLELPLKEVQDGKKV